jgi:hypothetical protein
MTFKESSELYNRASEVYISGLSKVHEACTREFETRMFDDQIIMIKANKRNMESERSVQSKRVKS